MKFKIWDRNTKKIPYRKHKIPFPPKPSYEVELNGGDVIEIEDDKGNTIFHIEVS